MEQFYKRNIRTLLIFLLVAAGFQSRVQAQNYSLTPFNSQYFCTSSYPTAYNTVSFSLNEATSATSFARNQTAKTMILTLPAGFQFNTAAGTVTAGTGGGITSISLTSVTTSAITITVTTGNNNTAFDTIYFKNFQVRATAAASGNLVRTGGTFTVGGATTNPTSSESFGYLTSSLAMIYDSSVVSQYSTQNINRNCTQSEQVILRIKICVHDSCPTTVTQFNLSTNGDIGYSQNPLTNITKANVYYAGNNPVLLIGGNTPLFGSFNNPNGAFTINGSQQLLYGTGSYYFFVTYEVPATANVGDKLDASISSFVMGGNTITNMITPNPTGTRTIVSQVCNTPDMPNPPANVQTVNAGSWVIPMDNTNQALVAPFNVKAYGLVHAMLMNDIPVKWVILSGKAKDAADFTANAARLYPTAIASAPVTFKASAFIIDTFYINHSFYSGGLTATQVLNNYYARGSEFAKVTVYTLTSNTAVNVRYTLDQRPKIACFNNGTYQGIATKMLDSAGVTNYVTISAGVFPGLSQCYTFCCEEHWDVATNPPTAPATVASITSKVWDFVYEGGNFFAQCAGVNTYENLMQSPRHFHSTAGVVVSNSNTVATNAYYSNDMAFMQFQGNVVPNIGGTGKNWMLNRGVGSQWVNSFYHGLSDATHIDTIVAAAGHFLPADSLGGNVFYLGGHDYGATAAEWTDITYLNAIRMFLNATLIPATRPTAFTLQPGLARTICAGQSTTLGGSPTGPSGSTYNWSPAASLDNPNAANPVATPTVTTTYTVVAQNGGCPGGPSYVTVTVLPLPAAPTASSNSPVCQGSSINLTASTIASATYSWTGPNTYSSTTQNPTITGATAAMAGTYTVTATVNGCTGPAGTTTVVINPSPAVPTPSSNSPICAGSTLNLTTPTVAGATYNWTGPNAFSSTLQNPSISAATVAASGTYSLTVTVAGCTSLAGTVAVTVNPIPGAPTAGSNSPVCAGSTLNLTSTTVAGATYSWTGPNGFSSTTQNPSISAATTAATGTYSVTVTVNGCTSAAGTVAATVSPIPGTPTAGSNSPVCAGSTLNLTTPTVAGATYSWTGPNSFTSTLQNPSISGTTAAAAGTYSVTITVGGCSSAAGTVSVTINPIPGVPTAGSNSPVCAGSTLNLTCATVAGATYSWTGPNSFTSTLQNPSITNPTTAASGTYSVTVTVGGCPSSAGTVAVTVNPTPATPTAGSNSPVCAGSPLNLTTPTVAGATYSWTGPNSFTSTSQNPSIASPTTAASGTYSVTVTVAGCTSAAGTVAVTVNPIPAAPTAGSNSPICAGSTINLTSTTIAGATYSWTGPNSFTSTIQNPTISAATVAASGTYSVTATVAGCTGPAGTVVVTVNPIPGAPSPGSNSPVCAGSPLNLTTATVAGATYSWTGPNSFSSTSQNPTIASPTTAASGTYSVTVTVNGCTSAAGTVAVTVNPIPATPTPSSNSPVCAGSTLNLTTTTVVGASYSWTGPNTFTSTLQNPSITSATTAASGTYSLTVTVAGCTSAPGTVAVTVAPPPGAPAAGSNSPVCTGTALNLTASTIVGASYSWTGPNSFTSTLQNPTIASATAAAAGTYTVIATIGGCTGPAGTVTVTVNPTPATPTAGSNSPICAGSTLNLTTPTVAGATYSWTGPNTFTSTAQNPSIAAATTAATGTYSITVTVNGCTSAAGTVSAVVNPIPASPVAGSNSPLCVGSTINLTSTTVVGATYSWTGPNAFSSTTQNPNITNATVAASGTYTVTATVAGCSGPSGTVTVTVNPIPGAPAAGSNSPVCAGSALNLTSTTVAGATYSWTGPNSFTSTSQNPTITSPTTAASGTYSVTVTVNGCTSAAGTVAVTVNPIPPTPAPGSNSPVCVGSTLNLNTGTVAGATYSWTGPNGFTSSLQLPSISGATVAASGTYTVTVTVAGCTSAPGTVTVSVDPPPGAPTAGSNSPVCSGNTINLTASTIVGATYSWTGPNGFSSSLQNPNITNATTLESGTYTVIATIGGCSGPAGTVTVTVNPTPGVPTAGSNSPLCAGSTLNLTSNTVAGATYSWTGPNGFSSTLQNPTVTNVSTLDQGTYSVNITVNGCTSATGTIFVTVHPIPATPTAGSNSPVCTGNTINLTSTTVAGATYSWTGPNTFSSTLQNPSITNATIAANGTYTLTATVLGCTSAPNTVTVTVNPTPGTPVAGSNSPICAGSSLNLTSNTTAGATYSWTGPNGFTSTSQNPSISGATVAATGTYTVIITVNGCPSAAATVSAVVNPIPTVPSAGSNSPLCIGATLNLISGTVAGATYSWTGPNGFTATTQNASITNVTLAATGTYYINVTVNGCTSAPDSAVVVVNSSPISPVAGSNTPVCTGTSLTLTASTIPGATYSWTGPNGFTSTTQNPTITPVTLAGAGTYTVTAFNGCSSSPATTTVVVNPTPGAPVAGSNTPICSGSTLNLTATNVAGATYSWTGPNSFTSTTQNPSITNASGAASGTYSVTVTVNGCTSLDTTTSVIVNVPAIVSAGSPQTVCANNNAVTLSGSSSTGSGIWSTSGTGTFSPSNTTLNGTYNPSAADNSAGTVTLTLTSTANGACAAVTNQMVVTITPAPTANAGPDQSVCANNASVNLSGAFTISSGAQWSTSGTGTFSPSNTSMNAVYQPSAADTTAGTVTLTLTTTGNGTCLAVTDQMIITITPSPAVFTGGTDSVCSNNPNVALHGTSSTGAGTWTTTGTGTFSPNNTTLNGTYIPSAADISAGSVTLTLTSSNNGNCSPVAQPLIVTFTPPPTANAGADVTVCANNASVALSGTSTTAAGTWTTSGTGTFVPNANTLNATYVPSNADTTAGSVTLTLTTRNNGGCLAVTDQMVINFTHAPTTNAGPDQTVCANNATVSLSGSFHISTGAVWSSSGTGTFSPNNTSMSTSYIPSSADTAAGHVTLYLTSTGNGTCNAAVDSMVVTINHAPHSEAGPNVITCLSSPNTPLTGFSSTGSGVWSTLGSGSFTPNANTANATYVPSTADTAAHSVILIYTTAANAGCNPVQDTLTITYAPTPVVNAGTGQTVCANNDVVTLNGTSSTGTGAWSTSGSGTFLPTSTSLNATYTPSAADTAAHTVTLTLTSTNGCTPITQSIVITITPAPVVNAGPDQSLCVSNPVATLNGNVHGGATTGQWTTLGSGTFAPSSTVLNPTYTPSAADLTLGNVTLVLTSTGNGNCNPVSDTVKLTYTPPPTAAAGPDQSACANNAVPLNGTITGGGGTGIWSTPNGTGVFSPSNTTLNGTYTPSNGDTAVVNVILVLTSTNNGGCTAVTDTMIIHVTPGPVVNAGPDQTVCGNNSLVTLNGTVLVASGGVWSTTGTGNFIPTNTSLNTTYQPSSADTAAGFVNLILTSTGNGFCQAVSDTVHITIGPLPKVNAGTDQFICTGTMTAVLNGSVTGGATTGQWSTLGTGTFSPSNTALNATYNLSSADTAAQSVTLVLTSTNNGGCLAVTDTMVIRITTIPVTEAGRDTSLCANNASYALNGSVIGGSGQGQWSSSGTGTFTPSNTALNATYNPSPADITAGSVRLILIPTGACLVVPDTVILTFTPAPVVNAGPDQTVCQGVNVSLAGSVTIATGGTWTSSGNGVFSPSNTALNAVYTPGSSDITAGSATLVLSSTGNGNCLVVRDTMKIILQSKPVAAFVHGPLCQNTTVAFTDSSHTTNGSIVSWNWNLGNGTSTVQNPVSTYTATGTQTVTLIVATSAGCSDTITKTLFVNPTPTANFSFVTACPDSAAFTNLSALNPGTLHNWLWNFGDSTSSILQNPTHTYANPGIYLVKLIATSDSGCVAAFNDSVTVQKCAENPVHPPAVPGAFTPNGDGHNDILYVRGGPFLEFDWRIFNEWGNEIFHGTSQGQGWDGTFKSKLQPGGSYVWVLTGKTLDNVTVKMKGEVTLIR